MSRKKVSKMEGQPKLKAWRPTPADHRLLEELKAKTGIVNETDIVRLGLRRLAEAEGLTSK